METNKYRKDIDGLRAVAVISVLLFHGGFKTFAGGYIGVDIFFVISGYLITTLILNEKNNNSFSLIRFYERRIRRIIPALFFVTFVSIIISLMLMPPQLLVSFAKSVISIPLFLSNFLFLNLDGYFATASEEIPLLHTWSLAVEEQYYLFFPIFVLLFWKFGKNFLVFAIFLICILSLSLAQFGANLSLTGNYYLENEFIFNAVPDFAFYFTLTRVWEILIGALTAFYLLEKKFVDNLYVNNFLAFFGAILIFISVIFFNSSTPFPSIYTLIPICGTVLLIISSPRKTFVNKILSAQPLVGIGLISYSVYLWHQPLLAFSRIIKSNSLSNTETIIILFFSIFLGYLSWKFIEAPFRNRNILFTRTIFKYTLLSSIFLVCIGSIIISNNGFPSRYSSDEIKLVEPKKFDLSICDWSNPINAYPKISFCNIGSQESLENSFIFYGDSHMDSLINSLDIQLQKNNLSGIKVFNEYCEPMVFIYRNNEKSYLKKDKCTKSHEALLRHLKYINTSNIFILFRWTFRLYPIDQLINNLTFDNKEGGIEYVKHYREYYGLIENRMSLSGQAKLNSINRFIESFKENNLKITLLYPIPEVGWNMPKYNNTKIILNETIPEIVSTDYSLYLKRNKFILDILDDISKDDWVKKIYSQKIFCNREILNRCITQVNGMPLYYDYDHLSFGGAQLITKVIMKEIND